MPEEAARANAAEGRKKPRGADARREGCRMTDDMLRGLRTADIEVASRRAAEGLAAAARRRGLVDVAVGAVDSRSAG